MGPQGVSVNQPTIPESVEMGRIEAEPAKSVRAVDRLQKFFSFTNQSSKTLEDVTQGKQSFEVVVLPWFKMLFFFFVIPDYIRFDPKEEQYRRVKGSLPRKVLTGLIVIGVLVDQLWGSILVIKHDGYETLLGVLKKVKCVVYFCFAVSVCHLTIFRVEAMCKILKSIREEALHYAEVVSLNKLQLLSYVFTGLYLLKAIHYSAFVNIGSRLKGQSGFLELLIDLGEGALGKYTNTPPSLPNNTHVDSADVSTSVLVAVGIYFIGISNGLAICWTMSYGLMSLWAVTFGLLFRAFVSEAQDDFSKIMTTDIIRKFQRLTAVLDDFNQTYGWVTFFCIATGICHFSIELIMTQYNNDNSGDASEMHATIGNTLMLLIYVVHLGLSAHVSYTANSITVAMKSRYQDRNAWLKSCENFDEVSQGLALVLNDLNSNRVGIQGGPFFTLTYAFAGTVVSIISTYAVLVKESTSGSKCE